jgi:hypothetical protein
MYSRVNRPRKRAVIRSGVIHRVPDDGGERQPHIPFGGRGLSLRPLPRSQALPEGPLSRENIQFLRELNHRSPSTHIGIRHTTTEADRINAAKGTEMPGFTGDGYPLQPPPQRSRDLGEAALARKREEMRQRLLSKMMGVKARPKQNSSSAPRLAEDPDVTFNRQVQRAMDFSVEYDTAQASQRGETVRQSIGSISHGTHFALADFGHSPRRDSHDTYKGTAAKFGRTTVPPERVMGSVTATHQQIRAGLSNQTDLDDPVNRMNGPDLRSAMSDVYGRELNRELDQMRDAVPRQHRLNQLNNEPPDKRRNRLAQAAKQRMQQQATRGMSKKRR